eukprot:2053349-Rhodomonas_salina.1
MVGVPTSIQPMSCPIPAGGPRQYLPYKRWWPPSLQEDTIQAPLAAASGAQSSLESPPPERRSLGLQIKKERSGSFKPPLGGAHKHNAHKRKS